MDTANLFRELHRPQYHLTPKTGGLIDPTDLIYYKGEYRVNNGLASSTDLINWKLGKRARLSTDKESQMSGSVVYDKDNTSGFGKSGKGPLVAIYSGLQRSNRTQYQCIAYSNDDGANWEIYNRNPVIDLNSTEFRDPQVFWHADTKKWVMAVAMAAQQKISFYGSANLKEWEHLSDFGPMGAVKGVWECPDIFPLYVDGNKNNKKWVLAVSVQPLAGQYFIGNFDGKTFKADKEFESALGRLKSEEASNPGEVLFDFENGFEGWKNEGDAFSDKPETGPVNLQGPVIGFEGKKFVNSFHNGDKGAGKLTSPDFTINKNYLNFLLGGGAYPKDLHVDLLVDGKIVRTMSGVNTEVLYWKTWNVAEFAGKKGSIQIVDEGDGDFRHILADQFTLSDKPASTDWEKTRWIDYGPDFYAVRSWVDSPDDLNHRTWVAWLGSWLYLREIPTSPWRGGHTFPRSVSLSSFPDGIKLIQQPVEAIAKLRTEHFSLENKKVSGNHRIPGAAKLENTYELIAEIDLGTATEVGFTIAGKGVENTVLSYKVATGELTVDRTHSGNVDFSPAFPGKYTAKVDAENRKLKIRMLVDRSLIEVFANRGEAAITSQIFPSAGSNELIFYARQGKATLNKLDLWKLKSIWNK
ncbi:glycoside hydrolase family 32 protein [Mucilaginibacter gynuensis]|uniref:glycoside hydrolase family 32 protein n=1 Tax=Mucilaginibacter gynuensis TaxID=1302236 RepID=UPI0031ECA88C